MNSSARSDDRQCSRALTRIVLLAVSLSAHAVWNAPVHAATRIDLDPNGTHVGFLLSTTWHNVEGRTSHVTGRISSSSGRLFEDGMVRVEVDAATLETGNARRDRTMRESSLETDRHPKITFASAGPPVTISTVRDASGRFVEVSFTVPGDLTIHGVRRRVSLPVTARARGAEWEMSGEIAVKLSEFQIPDPSIVVNRVKDEVTVTFTMRTRPAAQTPDGEPD